MHLQHGYLIDGGRAAEIRPLTTRLRDILHPTPQVETDIMGIGAHILRFVDPLPGFEAHASCGGIIPPLFSLFKKLN